MALDAVQQLQRKTSETERVNAGIISRDMCDKVFCASGTQSWPRLRKVPTRRGKISGRAHQISAYVHVLRS
jgi:hypothetical protein